MRTGGVEPPQREAAVLRTAELTECSAFAREGGRPDSNRHRGDHDPGCCRYTTTTTNADDRNRTGGLSVDSRALCTSELHPQIARAGFEPAVSSS
jgi:hypothetical protein